MHTTAARRTAPERPVPARHSPSPATVPRIASCWSSLHLVIHLFTRSFPVTPVTQITQVTSVALVTLVTSADPLAVPRPYSRPLVLLTGGHRISGVAHRAQQRALELRVDLLPQLADMHVHHVGLRVEMVVPDILQQHGARDYLIRVPHEVLEQLEFARLQRNLAVSARDLARQRIHMQVADNERRFVIDALRAPVQGIDAREQLAEGEGFGQIVISAAAQSPDSIVDLGQRTQNQNWRALAGFAQHLDDGEAVDVTGEHAIHDDDIIRLARRQEHPVAPGGGMIGGMAGFLQAFDDELRDPLIVFDQQDLQLRSPSGPSAALGAVTRAFSARFICRRPRIFTLNSSRYRYMTGVVNSVRA